MVGLCISVLKFAKIRAFTGKIRMSAILEKKKRGVIFGKKKIVKIRKRVTFCWHIPLPFTIKLPLSTEHQNTVENG